MTIPSAQALSVLTVPAFNDNYLWLIHDGAHAAVVDPGDAKPILAALKQNNLRLTAILLTHHHADHIGGVPELLQHYQVPVFGPRNEDIAAITLPVGEGRTVEVPGLALKLEVLDVPGHTMGHIAYVRAIRSEELNRLFPQAPKLDPGLDLFALLGADGTPIMVTDSRHVAVANAVEHDLVPVSVH